MASYMVDVSLDALRTLSASAHRAHAEADARSHRRDAEIMRLVALRVPRTRIAAAAGLHRSRVEAIIARERG